MSASTNDSLDIASERTQIATDARVATIRANAEIQPGKPGECAYCEGWNPRLIKGHCSRCRDALKLH